MAATPAPDPALGSPAPGTDQLPPYPQLIKALIAAARYSDGPTLFSIFQVEAAGKCVVHEQLPDGGCAVWPESYAGRCQAEMAIYQRAKTDD